MLPPLAAIEALERIDRLGSVGAAAEALSVTPSAISHRLRALDHALGFPVVAPRGRGLALTPEALRFLEEARPALATLAAAALRAGARAASGPLRIAAPPGFAASWMIPRLAPFREAYPGVRLTLVAGADQAADLSVIFAIPGATPPGAVFLMKPAFFPVVAPALARRAGGLRRPAALSGRTFLHLGDRRDWSLWAEACGAPGDMIEAAARAGREIILGDVSLLIAAARAGLGVALGDVATANEALTSGALIRPIAAEAPAERAYYLTVAPGAGPAARAFADWLRGAEGG